MMRTVHLHGALGEKHGSEFRLDVRTAGEAIRALHVNLPGFTQDIMDGEWELVRGELEDGFRLGLPEVNDFNLGKADFHILPAVAGSAKGGGGMVKAVLGVALIGAAVAFSGGALGGAIAIGGMSTGMTFGSMAFMGLALTVMGVATMLTPHKKATSENASFALNGPQNTYAQGSPVPLVYGRMIVGSVLVSSGLDVEPIPVGWDPTNGNTVLGTGEIEADKSTDPSVYTGALHKITFDDGTSTYGGGGGGSNTK